MKKTIIYIVVLPFFLILFAVPCASAMDFGLEFDLLPAEEASQILDNIELEVFYDEPKKYIIGGFDVSSDGSFALSAEHDNFICVYDANGSFLYGYRFECPGDYEFVLKANDISILFFRSYILATFDPSGNCIEIKKLSPLGHNRNRIDEIFQRTNTQVGDVTYCLESDSILASGYSRLATIRSDGFRTVLYDVTSQHIYSEILTILFALLFGAIWIVVICKHVKGTNSALR